MSASEQHRYNQDKFTTLDQVKLLTDHLTIAIDGPVASGKTTVGKLVARQLGCRFLDTGWMYRAISYVGLNRGLDIADEGEMPRLATSITMRLTSSDGEDRLIVDDNDITDYLREPDVERGASTVATISGVRVALVRQQRTIATDGPIVMVGRDIGTVVLQDAKVKVYLNATVEVRARRRYEERKNSLGSLSYDAVLKDLVQRDTMDTERADSPLRPATDSVIMDTDGMEISEVARRIVELVDNV